MFKLPLGYLSGGGQEAPRNWSVVSREALQLAYRDMEQDVERDLVCHFFC